MNTPVQPDDLVSAEERALVGELRERLRAARTQEVAARADARRLARELALTHRLLKFYLDDLPPARPATEKVTTALDTTLLSQPLIYHLDTTEDHGTYTEVRGWAFRPVPGWDARTTAVTLLLRHEDTVYATLCQAVRRADVAAFYAGQPPGASGGAMGLDGAGFHCKIRHDALPTGTEWKIILRLECAGQECEQFTGKFLRL